LCVCFIQDGLVSSDKDRSQSGLLYILQTDLSSVSHLLPTLTPLSTTTGLRSRRSCARKTANSTTYCGKCGFCAPAGIPASSTCTTPSSSTTQGMNDCIFVCARVFGYNADLRILMHPSAFVGSLLLVPRANNCMTHVTSPEHHYLTHTHTHTNIGSCIS